MIAAAWIVVGGLLLAKGRDGMDLAVAVTILAVATYFGLK